MIRDSEIYLKIYFLSFITIVLISYIFSRTILNEKRSRRHDYLDIFIFPSVYSIIVSRITYILRNISYFTKLDWDLYPLVYIDNSIIVKNVIPIMFFNIFQGFDWSVFLGILTILGLRFGLYIRKISLEKIIIFYSLLVTTITIVYMIYSHYYLDINFEIINILLIVIQIFIIISNLYIMLIGIHNKILLQLVVMFSYSINCFIITIFNNIYEKNTLIDTFDLLIVLSFDILIYLLVFRKYKYDKLNVLMRDWK